MSKISEMSRKARDMPDNLRLASIGAWRGRERGMAVFAGVFLASLVITTVLAYGVGLSQVFFLFQSYLNLSFCSLTKYLELEQLHHSTAVPVPNYLIQN